MSTFAAIIVLTLAIFLYFFPAFVACKRDHHNYGAIFILNMMLGWTALGWIAALVWACTNTGRRVGA